MMCTDHKKQETVGWRSSGTQKPDSIKKSKSKVALSTLSSAVFTLFSNVMGRLAETKNQKFCLLQDGFHCNSFQKTVAITTSDAEEVEQQRYKQKRVE